MMNSPINPGAVSWTGENPGIYLKETPEGPWTGLATFFRVVYSAYGMGTGVLVLDQPGLACGLPQTRNFCIADNETLARYMVNSFFAKFASFRVSAGTQAVTYLPLTEAHRAGDTRSRYQEIVCADELEVVMTWDGLGEPYAVDVPAAKGATGEHQMYSVFLDSREAGVTINGVPLRGRVAERSLDGMKKSSAFLAFSESWMKTTATAA